ncbi:MAG: hypothetical protein KatS3mg004_0382 [Bryobacteraceae bacterium]|nr:MAG: hypothetical protein KatS3mg004_0382 [Bryobacteraceae bacterium]
MAMTSPLCASGHAAGRPPPCPGASFGFLASGQAADFWHCALGDAFSGSARNTISPFPFWVLAHAAGRRRGPPACRLSALRIGTRCRAATALSGRQLWVSRLRPGGRLLALRIGRRFFRLREKHHQPLPVLGAGTRRWASAWTTCLSPFGFAHRDTLPGGHCANFRFRALESDADAWLRASGDAAAMVLQRRAAEDVARGRFSSLRRPDWGSTTSLSARKTWPESASPRCDSQPAMSLATRCWSSFRPASTGFRCRNVLLACPAVRSGRRCADLGREPVDGIPPEGMGPPRSRAQPPSGMTSHPQALSGHRRSCPDHAGGVGRFRTVGGGIAVRNCPNRKQMIMHGLSIRIGPFGQFGQIGSLLSSLSNCPFCTTFRRRKKRRRMKEENIAGKTVRTVRNPAARRISLLPAATYASASFGQQCAHPSVRICPTWKLRQNSAAIRHEC